MASCPDWGGGFPGFMSGTRLAFFPLKTFAAWLSRRVFSCLSWRSGVPQGPPAPVLLTGDVTGESSRRVLLAITGSGSRHDDREEFRPCPRARTQHEFNSTP